MKLGLLMSNASNRALVEHALLDECAIATGDDALASDVDVLVVDGPSLATSHRRIVELKRAAEPLLLPVLFVSGRPDVSATTPELWSVTSDVVTRPIVRRELVSRVRMLMRARELSLQLAQTLESERRVNEELRNTRQLYRRAREIAETLQRAALPRALPSVPGFALDAYYEPSVAEESVGGDWYDALCVADGRIVISIGDVAGAGLEAAVTMASVRQAIRAVAQIYPDPLTMLDAADRMLKLEQPGRIVTAFVGVVDPITMTMTYASAGHPPPLLRRDDGTVDELWAQSLPLGLRMRGDGQNHTCTLGDDATVLFFTDGLSEVTRDLREGDARLRRALATPAVVEAIHPAAAIKAAVYGDDVHADDVALLVLRVRPADRRTHEVFSWQINSDDAQAAAQARHEFVATLAGIGTPSGTLFTCELLFGELLSNVVRYAPGAVDIVLDTRAQRSVLHVLDRGKGFTVIPRLPSDLMSERGRGLFLVWIFSDDFSVELRPQGGAHARIVLPVPGVNCRGEAPGIAAPERWDKAI